MISYLKGIIVDKGPEGIVILCGGVGYGVTVPLSTLAGFPPENEEIALWIHTHVREDELRLFGFSSKQDRTAFQTMLKVSGVGPKVAIAVLGGLSGEELADAVNNADTKRLTAVPGIGKKTAERIVLELGGKLNLERIFGGSPTAGVYAELSSALKNLGFKAAEVDKILAQLRQEKGADQPFEDLLREGLALLRSK